MINVHKTMIISILLCCIIIYAVELANNKNTLLSPNIEIEKTISSIETNDNCFSEQHYTWCLNGCFRFISRKYGMKSDYDRCYNTCKKLIKNHIQ